MALGISDSEYKTIQESWDNFISLVKEKLNSNLKIEHRTLGLNISKLDMLSKALRYKPDDMNLIFSYRNILKEIDPSVEEKFTLLDAFEKRNNLDNDIAIETFKSISHDESLTDKINLKREEILEKRDQLYKKILDTADIINGRKFPYDLILEYINEFNLSKEQHNMVLFAGFNTIVKNIELKKQAKKETTSKEEPVEEVEDIIDISNKEDNKNEVLFNEVIQKYESIKGFVTDIINKYYDEINTASPEVKAAYYGYASYQDEAIKSIVNESQYDETQIKVQVIRLIQKQKKIEEDITAVRDDSSQDEVYAEVLNDEINEYEELAKKLILLEQKILTAPVPEPIDFENSKLFFITDESGNPLIPQEVIKEYSGAFKTFDGKVNSGTMFVKKNANVKKLLGVVEYEKLLNKTIFMQTSGQTIISYIKINLLNEKTPDKSEEAIAIITACGIRPNIIKETTKEVLNATRGYVCEQLLKIQHNDPEELKRQASIRKTILGNPNAIDNAQNENKEDLAIASKAI